MVDAYRAAIIDWYRDEVRAAMLERVGEFGSDPAFRNLSFDLATELGSAVEDAAELLWPTSHAIYKAAEAAMASSGQIDRLNKTIGAAGKNAARWTFAAETHHG